MMPSGWAELVRAPSKACEGVKRCQEWNAFWQGFRDAFDTPSSQGSPSALPAKAFGKI